jgi:hypothetical protein
VRLSATVAAQGWTALTTILCAFDPAIEKIRASIGFTVGVVEFMLMVDEAIISRANLSNLLICQFANVSDLQPAVTRGTAHLTFTPLTIPLLIYESERNLKRLSDPRDDRCKPPIP